MALALLCVAQVRSGTTLAASAARMTRSSPRARKSSPTDTPYAGISQLREDLTPEHYLDCATQWVHSGATLVGGCCGIGPEHISALRAHFR